MNKKIVLIAIGLLLSFTAFAEDCPEELGWEEVERQELTCLYKTYRGIGKLKLIKGLEFKWYHDNEELKEIGNYINGKAEGEWKEYHKNGALKKIGNYKNGKKEGEEKRYHENGDLFSIENYVNGKEEGEWKYYHENGKLRSIGNWKNGEYEGEWKYYHENGKLRSIGNWKNGEYEGEWKYYHENGKLESTISYKDRKETDCPRVLGHKEVEKQKLTCIWEWYYSNGPLGELISYENGEIIEYRRYDNLGNLTYFEYDGAWDVSTKKTIPYSVWYKKNKLSATIKNCPSSLSENAIRTNKLTCFYDNDNSRFGLYLKGKRQGEWFCKGYLCRKIEFDINDFSFSTDQIITNYQNGIKEGQFLSFERNSVELIGNYKNNLKEGEWVKYYYGRERNIALIGNYKNNLKEGEWKIYSSASLNLGSSIYHLNAIKNYKNGKAEGVWEFYYENGELSEELNYKNGIKHGKFNSYLKDGTLNEEGKYVNGKKILDLSKYQ